MLCGSLASMLYGRGYPQTRLHGRLGVVFNAFGGRPRYFTVASSADFLSVFTSPYCGQQNKSQFFRAFASFCTDMDLEFSYVSMLTYFLVIDNADENTMHILQLPKVFGFSFLLKNQGHLFPALSLSLTHTHSLFLPLALMPSYITSIQSCNKNLR